MISDTLQNSGSRAAFALLSMQRYSWEQGVAMQAFHEMGENALVDTLAMEAVYRQGSDGRCASIGQDKACTDPCSVGEALLASATRTGDARLKQGADKLLHWALALAPRSKEGFVYHMEDSQQFWVDSMYMLPPYLAVAGHMEEALSNLYGYYNALYDPAAGLMSHQWDDAAKTFIRKAHWGVGNGWALAAFARMLRLLPANDMRNRQRIITMALHLIDRLLTFKRPDHLFHDVVDDPATFIETNLSQMLAYTLYCGLADGWLDKKYSSVALQLYAAACAKQDAYGLVWGVCGAPTFDKAGVAPEGQAFFLLMRNARNRFLSSQK